MPEILAPAGSFDSLRAAIWAGADAVYLGGKSFSARASAANFSLEELDKAVVYAHRAKARVYVTVNTLLKQREIEPALDFVRQLYKMGVDAVIIQDLGVARLVREHFPNLEMHASTQTTTTSLLGVMALKELGFDRVVLARELRAEQVSEIAAANVLPVEIFVHGALCVAYSGQCLYSSIAGGRSGNRGMCAQVCRLPSQLLQSGSQGYLLSPRDLCLIGQVPLLMRLQAASWKIEGRARGADYVAEAVSAYRQARDTYLANPSQYAANQETVKRLQQAYNRRFTEGLFMKDVGDDFYNRQWPGHHGLPVGEVLRHSSGLTSVRVLHQLSPGDVVGLVGVPDQVTLTKGAQKGDVISLSLKQPGSLAPGEAVVRLFDSQRSAQLRAEYLNFEPPLWPVEWWVEGALGEPLTLRARSGKQSVMAQSSRKLEAAKHVTLTHDVVYKQLSKLGGTPFCMHGCRVNLAEDLYLPLSEINECRRQVLEELVTRLFRLHNGDVQFPGHLIMAKPHRSKGVSLGASVSNLQEALAAQQAGADWLVFGREWLERSPEEHMLCWTTIREAINLPLVLRLPRIMSTEEEQKWEKLLPEGAEVLAPSLGAIRLARARGCTVRGDIGLNVYNTYTGALPGLVSATVSAELNRQELQELGSISSLPLEIVIHGRQLLMVQENCLLDKGCSSSCGGCQKQDTLKDRKGYCFPVYGDYRCRSILLNSHTLSLIGDSARLSEAGFARLRLELAGEGTTIIEQTVTLYRHALLEGDIDGSLRKKVETLWGDLTRGHWQRGVM